MFDSITQKIVTYETVVIKKIDENSLLALEGSLRSGDQIISIEYNGKLYENIKTYTLNTLLLSSKSGDVVKINAKRKIDENTEMNISAEITLSDLFMYEIE